MRSYESLFYFDTFGHEYCIQHIGLCDTDVPRCDFKHVVLGKYWIVQRVYVVTMTLLGYKEPATIRDPACIKGPASTGGPASIRDPASIYFNCALNPASIRCRRLSEARRLYISVSICRLSRDINLFAVYTSLGVCMLLKFQVPFQCYCIYRRQLLYIIIWSECCGNELNIPAASRGTCPTTFFLLIQRQNDCHKDCLAHTSLIMPHLFEDSIAVCKHEIRDDCF